jgi:mannosyl-oligosaccharide glucosidase
MQILSSWFNLMDEDGWIGREQILGSEARSKVPAEFQVQYPHYANPPTLFMAVEALLDKAEKKGSADRDTVKAWLKSVYPLLQRHFDWYRRTQAGDIKSYDRPAFSSKEGYRWRGRTEQHILTSGLDDYPRAQPPHPGELHTDLISWMGLFSRNMGRISAFLGEEDDEAKYTKIAEAIRRNVDDLHWDAEAKTYCDATIDDYEESVHVCHKGYISIFPFMTGLLGPDHEHLGAILDLIGDEEELWSPHGIRSLSKKDEYYGTAENYWRSPVWMPLNYLIVKNLLVSLHSPKTASALC